MAHRIWRDFLTAGWEAVRPRTAQDVTDLRSEQARGVERLAENVILREADQRRQVGGKR